MFFLFALLASGSLAGYMPPTQKNQHALNFISFPLQPVPSNSSLEPPLGDGAYLNICWVTTEDQSWQVKGLFIWFIQLGVHLHHQHRSLQRSVVLFCVNPLGPLWPLGDLTPTLRHTELEIITPIWEKNTSASRAYQALFFL